jgi:hypothetical protein
MILTSTIIQSIFLLALHGSVHAGLRESNGGAHAPASPLRF